MPTPLSGLTFDLNSSIFVEQLNNVMVMFGDPTRAFEALAHDVRLAVIRLLIPAGPDGLPAGVIGDRIGQLPSALSFHLGRLTNAGLVGMRRVGRNQYYAVDYQQLSALIGFLVEDCCGSAPAGCMPGCPGMPQKVKARDRQKMAAAS